MLTNHKEVGTLIGSQAGMTSANHTWAIPYLATSTIKCSSFAEGKVQYYEPSEINQLQKCSIEDTASVTNCCTALPTLFCFYFWLIKIHSIWIINLSESLHIYWQMSI